MFVIIGIKSGKPLVNEGIVWQYSTRKLAETMCDIMNDNAKMQQGVDPIRADEVANTFTVEER